MSTPTGGNVFVHELELYVRTELTLAETSQPMTCPELIHAMAAQGYWSSPAGQTPQATLYAAIARDLRVMDATAFALARENMMPIIVFSIQEVGAIEAVLRGKGRATVVGG